MVGVCGSCSIDHSCGHASSSATVLSVTQWHVFLLAKGSFFVDLNSKNNNYAKNGKYFQEWEHQSVVTSAFSSLQIKCTVLRALKNHINNSHPASSFLSIGTVTADLL